MKTFHVYDYVTDLFLQWQMFQIRIVEKIKTYFMFCGGFFPENRAVYEITPKNFVEARKDADNKAPARGILISKPTRAQANARARISTSTHTHREICNNYCFPRQQCYRECASMLRYTYIVSLVQTKYIRQPVKTGRIVKFSVSLTA
jgi:hypothetical protein